MERAFLDVLEFHRAFRPDLIGTRPIVPGDESVRLRLGLIVEEYAELRAAIQADDLPGIADAIVDLMYVLIGCGVTYGIDLRPVWAAVHAANMAKAGGGRHPSGKVAKPPGWVPPDVAGILGRQAPLGAGGGG